MSVPLIEVISIDNNGRWSNAILQNFQDRRKKLVFVCVKIERAEVDKKFRLEVSLSC